MSITPLILGRGGSGNAIAKSLAAVSLLEPALSLSPAVFLERGANLQVERAKHQHAVLCIANPHALHADAIIAAEAAGFDAILCEKPAAVNLEQLSLLKNIKTPTAVFHVYRQTWGIQTLKQMILNQEFGEVISIEGRYWQSSTADAALNSLPGSKKAWKDEPALSGLYDVYIDLATHWIDAVSFLYGQMPTKLSGYRSYTNANSAHRDSYIRVILDYPEHQHALATISKNIHGAGNCFEISILGAKQSAHWRFERADEIEIGLGRDRKVLTRKSASLGSRHAPYHGLGWIEGYIEISQQILKEVYLKVPGKYPRLGEQLDLLQAMFKIHWDR